MNFPQPTPRPLCDVFGIAACILSCKAGSTPDALHDIRGYAPNGSDAIVWNGGSACSANGDWHGYVENRRDSYYARKGCFAFGVLSGILVWNRSFD